MVTGSISEYLENGKTNVLRILLFFPRFPIDFIIHHRSKIRSSFVLLCLSAFNMQFKSEIATEFRGKIYT